MSVVICTDPSTPSGAGTNRAVSTVRLKRPGNSNSKTDGGSREA